MSKSVTQIITKCYLPIALITILMSYSCKAIGDAAVKSLFPVSRDVALGKQLEHQLAIDNKIKILSRKEAPKAYSMLDNIVNEIKASGKLTHKDDFAWSVKIIDADVLNAFCAPGGYIYVYTGLMKYLDNLDDLAGVMGHEMAHADQRHSTYQMIKAYGSEMLLQVVLKDKSQSQLAQMAKSMSSLAFSRADETEADSKSVAYLCGSSYSASGAAGFFKKLTAEGQGGDTLSEFFSTHPSPVNRVKNIESLAKDCKVTHRLDIDYKKIVNRL